MKKTLSLLLGIYFLTTVLILGLNSVLNLNILSYQIFSNTYVIFPILFLNLQCCEKVRLELQFAVFLLLRYRFRFLIHFRSLLRLLHNLLRIV